MPLCAARGAAVVPRRNGRIAEVAASVEACKTCLRVILMAQSSSLAPPSGAKRDLVAYATIYLGTASVNRSSDRHDTVRGNPCQDVIVLTSVRRHVGTTRRPRGNLRGRDVECNATRPCIAGEVVTRGTLRQAGMGMSSGTWARAGRRQTNRHAAAMSSGCKALASTSGGVGVGRFSTSGVSVSPGKMTVVRMPCCRSSSMVPWASPTTPALLAWYTRAVRFLGGGGGDVDDETAALAAQDGHDGLGQIEGGAEVGGDHL